MNLRRLLVLAIALAAVPAAAAAAGDPAGPTISPPDSGALCDKLAGNPDDADFTGGTGVDYDSIDAAAAEPACRAALGEHPEERRYLYELARALRKKGDALAAVPFFEKAAAKGSLAALIGLGLLYEDGDGVDQDYAKAAEYYRKAADAGSVDGMGDLAYLYDAGDLGENGAAEAKKLYERQIALAGDEYARIDLGFLYLAGRGAPKDVNKAVELFKQAIAGDNPDASAEGKNSLAYLWAVVGTNLAEADRLVTEAIAAVGDDDASTKASYLDTRGWVRHRQGRDAEALADVEAAIALDAAEAQYFARQGDILSTLGRKAEARASWKKALSLPAPNPYDEPFWDAAAIQKKMAGGS